eukprot:1187884-Prorocentrum_minimum.AAC.2
MSDRSRNSSATRLSFVLDDPAVQDRSRVASETRRNTCPGLTYLKLDRLAERKRRDTRISTNWTNQRNAIDTLRLTLFTSQSHELTGRLYLPTSLRYCLPIHLHENYPKAYT